MRFNENANLDTSSIDDLRGSGGGGGGGLGGRVALGGGGLGIVGLIIYFLLSALGGGGRGGGGALPLPSGGGLGGVQQGQSADNSQIAQACQTGARRTSSSTARSSRSTTRSTATGPTRSPAPGSRSSQPRPNFFSGGVSTGCGSALVRRRALLLPGRRRDLHRPDLLQGARDPVRRAGRLVLPGLRDRARVRPPHPEPARHQPAACRPATAARRPVPCGWSCRPTATRGCGRNHATTVPDVVGPAADPGRRPAGRRDAALDTASRIGDDFIQSNLGGGRVNQSQFTHGSSAQREKWWTTGYQSGDPAQCDTFARGVNLGLSPPSIGTARLDALDTSSVQSGRTDRVGGVDAAAARPRRAARGGRRSRCRRAGSRASPDTRSDAALSTNAAERAAARAEVVEGEQQHGRAHLGADPLPLVAQAEPRAGRDLPGHREIGRHRAPACRRPARRAGRGSARIHAPGQRGALRPVVLQRAAPR